MKLEQLERITRGTSSQDTINCIDGELCDPEKKDDEFDTDDTDTVDLTNALYLLERCIVMMEDVTIKNGRIQRIPEGMLELMEEASEFLDQWDLTE